MNHNLIVAFRFPLDSLKTDQRAFVERLQKRPPAERLSLRSEILQLLASAEIQSVSLASHQLQSREEGARLSADMPDGWALDTSLPSIHISEHGEITEFWPDGGTS